MGNVDGNKTPTYSTKWEKAVAYHHGLYVPETYTATKTADDIRLAVASFSEKVHDGVKLGKVVRFDIDTFNSNANVRVLDLTATDSDLKGFSGGFQDGTYGFLMPHNPHTVGTRYGLVARFDLATFSVVDAVSLQHHDESMVSVTDFSTMSLWGPGFQYQSYGVLVPDDAGIAARFFLYTT